MTELIIVVLALIFGSFANNIISFYTGISKFDLLRSTCPCCNTRLKICELIPIFSYIKLKGRCAYCGNKIPLRYIIIEAVILITGILCYTRFGVSYECMSNFVVCYVLIIIAAIDLKSFIIPNTLVLILLVSSLIIALISDNIFWQNAAAGLITCSGLIILNKIHQSKKGMIAIGYGDIKLIFVLFLIYGLVPALVGIWLASFIGLSAYFIYRLATSQFVGNKIPFGTALAISFIMITLYGESLISYYLKITGL